MNNVINFPGKSAYQMKLDRLTNFELFDEMCVFMGLEEEHTTEFLTRAIELWTTVENRCLTDELQLVAGSLKQQYKYELKDL